LNKHKPTQLSGFFIGGLYGPNFELFRKLISNFAK
jgi:hypothetical protein